MVDGPGRRWRDWFFRSSCIVCRGSTTTAICSDCRRSLPWLRSACIRCAAPLPGRPTASECGACQTHPPTFDLALAAFAYTAPVDHLIHGLKYAHRLANAPILADLLGERIAAIDATTIDCLIPMPLHPARLRQRGFNQALEIARPIARALGIRLDYQIATRTRDTPAQVGHDLRDRRRNVRNAFAVGGDLTGAHVAILDDVLTSGATAGSLATALRKAGAKQVSVWVCARASGDRGFPFGPGTEAR